MNEKFRKIEQFSFRIMDLNYKGKKLNEHFRYRYMDYSFYFQERLRNELYDPVNLKLRSKFFRHGVLLWKSMQKHLIKKRKNHFPHLLFDRPWYTKLHGNKMKTEYYEEIISHFPKEECATVVDLHPKEFLRFLFHNLRQDSNSTINFWSYYKKPNSKAIKHLAKINSWLQQEEKVKEYCQEASLDYKKVINIAELILDYHLPQLLRYYATVSNIYDIHNPKKIMSVLETSGEMRTANYLAHKRGMKTYALQHGRLGERAGFLIKKINPTLLPDYMMVHSSKEKELMDINSREHYQLLAMGCPRYDPLKNFSINKEQFKTKHKIPSKKIIFWATQSHCWSEKEIILNIKTIYDFLKQNSDYHLIIKFHPREDQEGKWYHEYKEKYQLSNVTILQAKEEDTYACIYASDVIITKASSAGIEGILLNRPVINLNLVKTIPMEIWRTEKIGMIAESPEDSHIFLKRIYTTEFQKEFQEIRNHFISNFFANFGSSGRKIAEFVKNN